MTSISVSRETKADFDELKDDQTHDEMMQELIRVYQMQDTELVIDEIVAEIIAEIEETVATKAELSAYRGTKDAIETVVIDE